MTKIFIYMKEELLLSESSNILKAIYHYLLSPKRRILFLIRCLFFFELNGNKHIKKVISDKLSRQFGSYISSKATVGKRLELRHPVGLVIGEGVEIGEDVVIYQHVTLGGKVKGDARRGNYPVVDNGATIFSGAKILGSVRIGENSVIGANSVVINDVEPNSIYAGIPAKKISDLANDKDRKIGKKI